MPGTASKTETIINRDQQVDGGELERCVKASEGPSDCVCTARCRAPARGVVLLTSSFRLLTNSTPLAPVCPAKATLPAAAAAAAAALRGFRAPGGE